VVRLIQTEKHDPQDEEVLCYVKQYNIDKRCDVKSTKELKSGGWVSNFNLLFLSDDIDVAYGLYYYMRFKNYIKQ